VVEDIGVAGVVKTERCLAKGWEVAGWEARVSSALLVSRLSEQKCRRDRVQER
jgi:hypothetical protein